MKVYFLFIAVFLAAILMDSCGSSPEPPQPTSATYSNPFFPLEVGNYWTYVGRFSTSDTLKHSEVIDTIQISGNKYYELVQSYVGKLYGQKSDTLLLRFANSNLLVRYVNGHDSSYIDFGTFATSFEGPRYPGVVALYPETDTIPLGTFDSCKYIVFRGGAEEVFHIYAPNIGEIIRYTPGYALVKAKIGGTIY
jgi:hypothetical protein